MQNKTILITGATSGIGHEAACQLAGLGATLILGVRDTAKAQATVAEIRRRAPGSNVTCLSFDSSSQASIRAFAKRVRDAYPHLDVLANNAGISTQTRHTTPEGLELTFATNVVGYWLLTEELLPLLRASAPSRIVNTASTFTAAPNLDDPQFERRPYKYPLAYQESKASNRMLSWALARRLEGSGVTVNAFSPGLVQTGLYRQTSFVRRQLLRFMGLLGGRTVQQGADPLVWLATSPELAGTTGKMFDGRREIPCAFRDVAREERLYAICEHLTAKSATA